MSEVRQAWGVTGRHLRHYKESNCHNAEPQALLGCVLRSSQRLVQGSSMWNWELAQERHSQHIHCSTMRTSNPTFREQNTFPL